MSKTMKTAIAVALFCVSMVLIGLGSLMEDLNEYYLLGGVLSASISSWLFFGGKRPAIDEGESMSPPGIWAIWETKIMRAKLTFGKTMAFLIILLIIGMALSK